MNARFRKSRTTSHSLPPTSDEQAALKVLHLVALEQQVGWSNPVGRMNGSKPTLNAVTIHYGGWITELNNQ